MSAGHKSTAADALDAYVEALIDGDVVDVDEWLERNPGLDDALRADLELVASLHRAADSVAVDSVLATSKVDDAAEPLRLLEPGTRLGEHVIGELLGAGGMGEVYRARHEVLDKDVALKVLRPYLADDPDAVARFRREVQAQAKLAPHPHVVTATHASEQDGRLYLVMEYVPGTNLARLVRTDGALAPERAAELIRQAASGLAHAHAAGLVHRDVKPSNLLLTEDGTVKVVDLGLARLAHGGADEEGRHTWVDELVGSLDYMAPEQANHPDDADERSDLYALGCTLYYLLEGRAPFADRLALKKLMAHAIDPPPALSRPVPTALRAILSRLLEKEPDARYSTAEELAEALGDLDVHASSEGETVDQRLPKKREPKNTVAPEPRKPITEWRTFAIIGVIIAAIAAAVFFAPKGGSGLAEGAPIGGSLESGDRVRPKEGSFFDAYRVQVQEGVTYVFTMRSQELDPMLVLRTDGWEIDQCDDSPGHGLTAQIIWTADRAEVELVATSPEEQTGPYTVSVQRISTPQLTLDEQLEGTLDESDTRYSDGSLLDRYWLHVEAGETYILDMQGVGLLPFLFLENDERRMLARSERVEGETNEVRLVYIAEKTGAVFVGANAQRPGDSGSYRLSVASEQAGEEVLLRSGVLSDGDETLGDESYYDTYELSMQAGRTYVITMRSDDFDTYLLLVDPEETRVAQNDDAIGTDSRIVYRARDAQAMRIFANSYTSGMQGEYTLTVRELPE